MTTIDERLALDILGAAIDRRRAELDRALTAAGPTTFTSGGAQIEVAPQKFRLVYGKEELIAFEEALRDLLASNDPTERSLGEALRAGYLVQPEPKLDISASKLAKDAAQWTHSLEPTTRTKGQWLNTQIEGLNACVEDRHAAKPLTVTVTIPDEHADAFAEAGDELLADYLAGLGGEDAGAEVVNEAAERRLEVLRG